MLSLKRSLVAALAVFAVGAAACSSHDTSEDGEGLAQASAPTFSTDIAPLFQAHCQSCHHPGGLGPFSLVDYQDAAGIAQQIKTAVQTGRMPHGIPVRLDTGCSSADTFVGPRRLTPSEIDVIARWADTGAREGDPQKLPPPVSFEESGLWKTGEPDLVIGNGEEGFYVPRGIGRDVFRRFAIPTSLDADRYITGFEAHPGIDGTGALMNRVVHHVTLFIDPTGGSTRQQQEFATSNPEVTGAGFEGAFKDYETRLVGMWFPGSAPVMLGDGMGIKLPKGASIVMEVHYATFASGVVDKTVVGLHLATRIARELKPTLVKNEDLRIPANVSGVEFSGARTFTEPVTLYSLTPHMHQLGTDFSVTVELPGAAPACLADVAWDFEHQTTSTFRKPLALPAGTTIRTRCVYDNTQRNPHQFQDPPKEVVFGTSADHEMCQLTLGVTTN